MLHRPRRLPHTHYTSIYTVVPFDTLMSSHIIMLATLYSQRMARIGMVSRSAGPHVFTHAPTRHYKPATSKRDRHFDTVSVPIHSQARHTRSCLLWQRAYKYMFVRRSPTLQPRPFSSLYPQLPASTFFTPPSSYFLCLAVLYHALCSSFLVRLRRASRRIVCGTHHIHVRALSSLALD